MSQFAVGSTLLIAGTDTDVGKTMVTAALAAYWFQYVHSPDLALLKLMQTGTGDRPFYQNLFQLSQSDDEICPLSFAAPLAPPLAADLEGRAIDLGKVWRTLVDLQKRYGMVLVEGLGGLGSPVTHEWTVADLARDWRLPTVLVVPVRLGAIAQAVANGALARQMGVNLRGIILNCCQPCSPQDQAHWAPPDIIQNLTQVPILGCLPHVPKGDGVQAFAQAAAGLEIEGILPLAAKGWGRCPS